MKIYPFRNVRKNRTYRIISLGTTLNVISFNGMYVTTQERQGNRCPDKSFGDQLGTTGTGLFLLRKPTATRLNSAGWVSMGI